MLARAPCVAVARVAASSAARRATRCASSASSSSASSSQALAEALATHSQSAARLTPSDHARVIVDTATTGVLSTIGTDENDLKGFPCGGVVAYAADDVDGLPTFALSALSAHARDVGATNRATLTVCAPGFDGIGDARVSLSGHVREVEAGDVARVREGYLKRHPNAFWVDFGDFTWYKMTSIVACRIVGGFARAASVKPDEYAATTADPVAKFSAPVCSHMNADHGDSLVAMMKHYVGIDVDSVEMRAIDRLGIDCRVKVGADAHAVRLPFTEPALDRKAVKDRIVEMTKAAAAAN